MSEASDVQSEISREVARIMVAQEILARLVESDDDTIRELLSSRAESLGTRLTETELEVISQFVGESGTIRRPSATNSGSDIRS